MTSNWTSLFLAGSLLFVTTQIAAEEHAVLGQGNVSCGSWLNDRKGEDAASSRIATCDGLSNSRREQVGERLRTVTAALFTA
jgi:hypothetical protein